MLKEEIQRRNWSWKAVHTKPLSLFCSCLSLDCNLRNVAQCRILGWNTVFLCKLLILRKDYYSMLNCLLSIDRFSSYKTYFCVPVRKLVYISVELIFCFRKTKLSGINVKLASRGWFASWMQKPLLYLLQTKLGAYRNHPVCLSVCLSVRPSVCPE